MFACFKHCSLFRQLIGPMVLVGLVAAVAVAVSAYRLQASINDLGEMYSASGQRLESLQALDKALAQVRALALKHLTSESAPVMQQTRNDLDAVTRGLRASLATLGAADPLHGRQAAADMAALDQTLRAYLAGIDEAVTLSADFEKESGFEVLTRAEDQHLSRLQATMRSLIQHAIEDIASSRGALVDATQRNLRLNFAIGFLGGLLLLAMAFFVSRRASVRITGLLQWSKRISGGDLSNPLVSDARDEVGQLTNAMRDMVCNLARGRSELEQAHKQAEETAEALRQYANAFENSGEAMLIADRNNRIVNVNAAFTEQTGYTLDEVRGQNPNMLSSGQTPPETYAEMWRSLQEGSYWSGELWDRKKSGEVYPKDVSISAIRDAAGEVAFYVASFADISERKANEARIDYLAHHDPLTGLINRYNLENRLDQALLSAHRDGHRMAVMFIDMDRFKTINDSLGHHVGDRLLVEVARRLRASVRESDIVARLGGDEFIVVLTSLTDVLDVAHLADKILRTLRQPYDFDGKELHSTPSIGIAVYPGDGEDGPTLMKNADTAMYHAKDHGRNNVQYFTTAMNVAASERLSLENDLHQALRLGQIALHYQPQIRTADGHCVGVEALARWHHPVLGDISPLRFIAIAEESGLIESLGAWVLEEACRQLAAWRAEGLDGLHMAVNLSAPQLRAAGFAQAVAGALTRHRLAGGDLEIEITESVAMEDPERAIDQLQSLRDLGVQLAIDDFGTGYSSLAYLKRLPIQVLKLDRTFVRDIETDPSDAEISAATLALAHNLGLQVTAEGVETEGQRDFLARHQCDFMQGYLFSRPVPAAEIPGIVRRCRAGSLVARAVGTDVR
ncbi:MAG: putative bifunctional diguanylate cyclase/phosphodiesterase [Gammaproteobacteria bacterium]